MSNVLLVAATLALVILISYSLAMLGEPTSAWFWRFIGAIG